LLRLSGQARATLLLQANPTPPYATYKLGKDTVLEIRGDGHQSVLPPSLHPSGELYAWADDTLPASISESDLVQLVNDALTGFALSQAWATGDRHQLGLAAAGMFAQRGIDRLRAEMIVGLAAEQAGDVEEPDRLRAVKATYERFEAALTVVGMPTLRGPLSTDAAKLIAKL
jgi:putative DNA primase/helicase